MDMMHRLWPPPWMAMATGLLVLLVVAWLAGVLTRLVLLRAMRRIAARTAWTWDDALFQHGVFRWLARLVPMVMIQFGLGLVPDLPERAARIAGDVAQAFMVFFVVMAVSRALTALETLYQQTRAGAQRPIKGLLQLAKLLLFIVGALVVIGTITDRKVGLLLSGLGAMSAVLILIFKDTILGFVAGLQLSSNDMLRVGDWITVPGAGADGDVVDITLYTVKVRNFDQAIVTVPTWKLIPESYQNWRGMAESGGRRIKRTLNLDASGVHFLGEDELARLSRFRLLGDYLQAKQGELDAWNVPLGEAGEQPFNRRRLTNFGTFRAYVSGYLLQHPQIHREMTCMVRQLASSPQGVPLELYCFTATTAWAEYENIQADIFDHLIALLPEFGLALYQPASGHDLRAGMAALDRAAAPGDVRAARAGG